MLADMGFYIPKYFYSTDQRFFDRVTLGTVLRDLPGKLVE